MNKNCVVNFGCNVGDTLFVIYENDKICRFVVDCLKVFKDSITAHGMLYKYQKSSYMPIEYNLKHLNKRIIFTSKERAEEYIKRHQQNDNIDNV